jgi:hypothetical protein
MVHHRCSQIRGLRAALGPDLSTTRRPLSLQPWASLGLAGPSQASRTQGLVRPGPINKRQPCQIGLAAAAWGNGPLISFVILPGCPAYP